MADVFFFGEGLIVWLLDDALVITVWLTGEHISPSSEALRFSMTALAICLLLVALRVRHHYGT